MEFIVMPPSLFSKIDANYRNFTALDVDALKNLPKVKKLKLDRLEIPHLTHDYLKNLTSVTNLTLQHCEIEEIDPHVFSDLKNLEEVGLNCNKLTKLPQNLFKNNPKLEKLTLIWNRISNLTWDEFEGLDTLKVLYIGQNSIKHFDAEKISKNMPNLRELNVFLTKLKGSELEKFQRELQAKLNQSPCKCLRGSFESIFLLILVVNLQLLSLWKDCLPEISDIEPRKEPLQINEAYTQVKLDNVTGTLYATSLSKLSKITDLQIYTNGLEDVEDGALEINTSDDELYLKMWGDLYSDSFSKLDNITHISIFANNLTEIQPGAICSNPALRKMEFTVMPPSLFSKLTKSHLENCQNLEELEFYGSYWNFTALDVDALENLPKVKKLKLDRLEIPHLTHDYLKNLTSVTNLTLQHCEIEEIDPDVFSDLKNLEEVGLNCNKLTKLPQNLFKNNPKLEKLTLVSNRIRNLTWDEFEGLDTLKVLYIGQNSIKHFDAEKIAKNMPNLRELNVFLTKLKGSELEEFQRELQAKLNHTVNVSGEYDHRSYSLCV
ncbi:Chaoptin-like Protein [Tribolium castaneum]|uniref:Chaoptin-like Protein n=2 Tax=Tribolium castaneum TaxID=7070 RepID=A0A139WKX2_TRICA|nr:Chaoptin-like Protein [Tribolium castaneum]